MTTVLKYSESIKSTNIILISWRQEAAHMTSIIYSIYNKICLMHIPDRTIVQCLSTWESQLKQGISCSNWVYTLIQVPLTHCFHRCPHFLATDGNTIIAFVLNIEYMYIIYGNKATKKGIPSLALLKLWLVSYLAFGGGMVIITDRVFYDVDFIFKSG